MPPIRGGVGRGKGLGRPEIDISRAYRRSLDAQSSKIRCDMWTHLRQELRVCILGALPGTHTVRCPAHAAYPSVVSGAREGRRLHLEGHSTSSAMLEAMRAPHLTR